MTVPVRFSAGTVGTFFEACRTKIVPRTKTGTASPKNGEKLNKIKPYRRYGFSIRTVW